MENNEFDKLFGSLKEREITPSNKALQELQDRLKKEEIKRKKRSPLWWSAAAVVVILLSLGVGFVPFKADKITPEIAMPYKPEIIHEHFIVEKIEPEETFESLETKIEDTSKEKQWDTQVSKTERTSIIKDSIIVPDTKREELLNNQEAIAEHLIEEFSTTEEKEIDELLKPVDEEELNRLLQQHTMKNVIAQIDDEIIMQLLLEAQISLESESESQLALSKTEELLEEAEKELKYDRSLQGILQKAIENGIVEVHALFKR